MAVFGIKIQSFSRYFSPTFLLGFSKTMIEGQIRNKFIHTARAHVSNPKPNLYPDVSSCQPNPGKLVPLIKSSYGIDENPGSRIYKVEEEEKGGSESDLLMPRLNCSKKWKVEGQDEEEELADIKKGDIINLTDLLFTESRDYLVKCNDDQEVKAEQLAGKVILIYFLPIRFDGCPEFEYVWTTYLIDIYNHLVPNDNFEVVVVAFDSADDDFRQQSSHSIRRGRQKKFEKLVSEMPWTAIPFSDITSRKRIARRFGVSYGIDPRSIPFVVDSKGMVLNCDAHALFGDYGTLGYPFSDERIKFLDSEDAAVAKKPSLEALLGSHVRDYVISNKGDKVPIHTLKDKVVALYFYEEFLRDDEDTIQLMIQLKMAYKELAKNKENFEVVLLYLYNTSNTYCSTNEKSFWRTFKTMPWLALPFKDPNHMKLVRIFGYPWRLSGSEAPTLVIFGPHGEFIDPYGAKILMNFGTPAYPFTREKLFKLESEKINSLKLEMLWDPNAMFGVKNGFEVLPKFFLLGKLISSSSNIQLSQLGGKRLVLFFEMDRSNKYDQARADARFANKLNMLKKRYLQMKGTDDEFEVIHMKESSSSNNELVELPWLVHYYGDNGNSVPMELLCSVLGFTYYCGWVRFFDCSLVAFDRDGRLVRRTTSPTFEDMDFPFYDGGLEKELWYDLDETFWLSNRLEFMPICDKFDENWSDMVTYLSTSDQMSWSCEVPNHIIGFGLSIKHVFIIWFLSGLWKYFWYVLET